MLRLVIPLLTFTLPDGSFGGGKARLRGVDPHLNRHLESFASELGHRVPNLHFRAADDISCGSVIHRVGHLLHHAPTLLLHPCNKLLPIQ